MQDNGTEEICPNTSGFQETSRVIYCVVLAACSLGVISNVWQVACFAVKLFKSTSDTIHLCIVTMVIGDTILAGYAYPTFALVELAPNTKSPVFCNSVHFARWLGQAISGLSLDLLNLDKTMYFMYPLTYLAIDSKWAMFACVVTCIFAISFVGSLWLSKTIRVLDNCYTWAYRRTLRQQISSLRSYVKKST